MATVTVCSKLPFGFVAEFAGKSVTFNGARMLDPVTKDPILIDGYGMTHGVDADWFTGWKESVGNFPPVLNGAIFAAAANKADAEAAERAPEVSTGLEQKSSDELGVEVVAMEN